MRRIREKGLCNLPVVISLQELMSAGEKAEEEQAREEKKGERRSDQHPSPLVLCNTPGSKIPPSFQDKLLELSHIMRKFEVFKFKAKINLKD